MAIAVGLDPAWTTNTGTSSTTSAAFSPAANSLIVVTGAADSGTSGISASISDSVGLTWTQIGTAQIGTSGGTVVAFWAYTSSAQTNMTVTLTWSGTGTTGGKGVKPTTWTGAADTAAVTDRTNGTATTNNLTVNYTNGTDGSRGMGVAVDWNQLGLPTSTDTATGFDISGAVSGISVYKAANTSGTGGTVGLNMNAGGGSPAAWAYKTFEILPAAGGTNATAENASATGAAETPQVKASPSVEAAVATGIANDSTVTTAVVAAAENAAATATANDATVTTTGGTSAAAEAATATGTAETTQVKVSPGSQAATAVGEALFDATGGSISIDLVADAPIDVTATANNATTSVGPTAEPALAAGTANDATVTTGSGTSAAAENAAATATANDATVTVSIGVESATAIASALNPSVLTGSLANAECAAAIATANDATAGTSGGTVAAAGVASATAIANDAMAAIAAMVEVALASVTVYEPTISGAITNATSAPLVTAGRTSVAPVTTRRTSAATVTTGG